MRNHGERRRKREGGREGLIDGRQAGGRVRKGDGQIDIHRYRDCIQYTILIV